MKKWIVPFADLENSCQPSCETEPTVQKSQRPLNMAHLLQLSTVVHRPHIPYSVWKPEHAFLCAPLFIHLTPDPSSIQLLYYYYPISSLITKLTDTSEARHDLEFVVLILLFIILCIYIYIYFTVIKAYSV